MKHFAASASASAVLAQHSNAQQQQQRPAAQPSSDAGLRQYQVLQSRSEPAQRTLALKMR